MTDEDAKNIRNRLKNDSDKYIKRQSDELLSRYRKEGFNLMVSDIEIITLNDLTNDVLTKIIGRLSVDKPIYTTQNLNDTWILIFKDVIFKRRIETIKKLKEKNGCNR